MKGKLGINLYLLVLKASEWIPAWGQFIGFFSVILVCNVNLRLSVVVPGFHLGSLFCGSHHTTRINLKMIRFSLSVRYVATNMSRSATLTHPPLIPPPQVQLAWT